MWKQEHYPHRAGAPAEMNHATLILVWRSGELMSGKHTKHSAAKDKISGQRRNNKKSEGDRRDGLS
jgi:hypothetical protein